MNGVEIIADMKDLTELYQRPVSWQPFRMTTRAEEALLETNRQRTKQHPFNWDHLVGVEFNAGFIKVTPETPIMTEKDHKILLALIFRHTHHVSKV